MPDADSDAEPSPAFDVVEFFGLPASGKSTTAKAVADELSELGYLTRNPTYRTTHETRTALKYPKMVAFAFVHLVTAPVGAARVVATVTATNQRRLFDAVRLTVYCLYLSRCFARIETEENTVHLFDQGVHQALWSIAYSSTDVRRETLIAIRDAIAPSGRRLVVELTVGVERATERLEARTSNRSRIEKSRHSGDSEEMGNDRYDERVADAYDAVRGILYDERTRADVRRLDTEGNSLDENCGEVVRSIEGEEVEAPLNDQRVGRGSRIGY